MDRKPGMILRAAEILAHRRSFSQRLNPKSRIRGTGLARRCGLERVGVSIAWLAPGKESFAYHAHRHEEEWLYVVSGRGVAIVAETEHEIGPGDFLGFPTPSVAHLLRNDGAEDLVYLMGGENRAVDVVDFPRLGKSFLLMPDERGTGFYELAEPQRPFGPADEE